MSSESIYSLDEKIETIQKQNEQYLKEFGDYLKRKNLVDKTIQRHVNNVDFYINSFLCYYEPQPMENGCSCVSEFLGDWFIRKATWSSCEAIKANCASLKKFYKLMLDKGYIGLDNYLYLEYTIREGKERWLSNMQAYDESFDEAFF